MEPSIFSAIFWEVFQWAGLVGLAILFWIVRGDVQGLTGFMVSSTETDRVYNKHLTEMQHNIEHMRQSYLDIMTALDRVEKAHLDLVKHLYDARILAPDIDMERGNHERTDRQG